MKLIKSAFKVGRNIIFFSVISFYLSVGYFPLDKISKLLPSRSNIQEKNTFLIFGILYFLFILIFLLRKKKIKRIDFYDVFIIFLTVYAICAIPRFLNLRYFGQHFLYLARAFLHGELYIYPIPNLIDAVFFNGKLYVAFPPFPALLMIPLVLLFNTRFNDIIFTIIFGAFNVSIVFIICKKLIDKLNIYKNNHYLFGLIMIFSLGTVHWHISCVEGVWYVAHIIMLFFLLLAINESIGRNRPFLIGLFWSFSVMTRPTGFFAFPFFVARQIEPYLKPLKIRRELLLKLMYLFLPVVSSIILLGIYNLARFGNFFDFGYEKMILGGQLGEDIKYGQFNVRFVLRNFYVAFFKTPHFTPEFPFFTPDAIGMSMFFTSPAFLIAFKGLKKSILSFSCWLSIIFIFIPHLLYFNTGSAQFGYRFSLDFTPFLIILIIVGTKGKFTQIEWVLILLSILVNLRGLLWIMI